MELTPERNSEERPEASGGTGHEATFSNQVRTINLALQGAERTVPLPGVYSTGS
jgi:hypothetical protein